MIIIWGSRDYGRVEGHGGEYAVTRFAHVYFLPLFPTGAKWIKAETDDGKLGHPCSLVGASVAAGYLRVWGPLVGVPALVRGLVEVSPLLIGIGLVMLALMAWSWTWRSLRTARARRRSDLNFVAFGTRCEPHRLPREVRAELRRSLEKRWEERGAERSPNDVAQHGARDGHEAAIAYGLLRIASIDRKRRGGSEAADAERILDDVRTPVPHDAGPYREAGDAPAPAGPSLAELVASSQTVAAPSPAQRATTHKRTLRRARLGLALATLCGVSGITMIAKGMQPTLVPDLATLEMDAPLDRDVRVTCDAPPEWLGDQVDERGQVTDRIAMCALADRILVVRLDAGAELPARVIEGRLHRVDRTQPWARELAKDPAIHTLPVWIGRESALDRALPLIVGVAFVLLAPGAWIFYVRWRRRTKAAAA